MLLMDKTRTTSPHEVPATAWREPMSESDRVVPLRGGQETDESSDRAIKDLIARRKQLLDMHTAERHRASRGTVAHVEESIRSILAFVEDRIRDTEEQLESAMSADPVWRDKDRLLQSVPGIDSSLAKQLLMELPELGSLAGRQIASYVGVVPLGRSNGDTDKNGQRARGGSAVARGVLHSATTAVMQHDGKMKAFYDRLRAAGKPENVAIMACMRKMLVILNTIVKGKTVYDPERE